MSLHRNGMRVVLDVVYNHTASVERSNFNLTVPGYFYRPQRRRLLFGRLGLRQ